MLRSSEAQLIQFLTCPNSPLTETFTSIFQKLTFKSTLDLTLRLRLLLNQLQVSLNNNMEDHSNILKPLKKLKENNKLYTSNQKIHRNFTKNLHKPDKLLTIDQLRLKSSKENNNATLIDTKELVLHIETRTFKIRVIFTLRMREKPEKWKNTES